MLQNAGIIHLPSQRTLRDYTHYTTCSIGFSPDVDKQLRDAVDMSVDQNRYRDILYVSTLMNTSFLFVYIILSW